MIFPVNLPPPLSGNEHSNDQDIIWMHRALALAKAAANEGEVPVGAIVVYGNEIIGEGFNRPISLHDPSAHAEMLAMRNAAEKLTNYRLPNTTLYVTLEPCLMCAGAMVHARIGRLVFGAFDPRAGAVVSQAQTLMHSFLNHKVQYTGGILAKECGELLTQFFKARR